MTDFAAARKAMVDCQIRPADVTRFALIDAMLAVPRERFVPKALRPVAYADAEVDIAPGRALLEPRTLAKMIDAAGIGPGDLVLEIAPGTGYSSAVIAHLAEAVVAIEPVAGLAEQARTNLSALEIDNVAVAEGDPAGGDPVHGPYEVIFINAAVEQVPDALRDQLKDGGRLVAIFADRGAGQCRVLTRAGAGFSERYIFDANAPVLPAFAKAPSFSF